jgi:hypothetical protein
MSVGREITFLAHSGLPSEVRATAPNPDVIPEEPCPGPWIVFHFHG